MLHVLDAEGGEFSGLRPIQGMTPDPTATILLVEDDLATRTFLADNLSADGYELLVADCVSDGLRLLERKFPDLALIDLNLPDASGYELLRLVRSADGVSSRLDPQTPLMVLSGRSSELDRVRGFDRGADDYVCKPFSYPELRRSDFQS
jgi:DNA-binding response OmpR family regulator